MHAQLGNRYESRRKRVTRMLVEKDEPSCLAAQPRKIVCTKLEHTTRRNQNVCRDIERLRNAHNSRCVFAYIRWSAGSAQFQGFHGVFQLALLTSFDVISQLLWTDDPLLQLRFRWGPILWTVVPAKCRHDCTHAASWTRFTYPPNAAFEVDDQVCWLVAKIWTRSSLHTLRRGVVTRLHQNFESISVTMCQEGMYRDWTRVGLVRWYEC